MSAVAQLEQYRDVRWIAGYFDMSVRWVEYRVAEGLPSVLIKGRRKFRASECEDWLRREGHIQEEGE